MPLVEGLSMEFLREKARAALNGVGDASLGEWETVLWGALTLRRRLTAREQRSVSGLRDLRGTPEAKRRWKVVERYIPEEQRQGWIEDERDLVIEHCQRG
jgi:hypothetical protein